MEEKSRKSWNFEDTKNHTNVLYGDDQSDLVESSCRSIIKRAHYSIYHFHEYRRLIKERFDNVPIECVIQDLLFPSEASLLSGGVNIQTGVAAHIVALTQSLHATLDTLGHVIAFATGLNIQEDKISLWNVIKKLEGIADTNKLADLCKDFYNSDERKYLSHLVNYSKHRSIVRPDIHVDATGTELRTFKLVFDGFNYSGRKYQPKDVDLVLEPTYSLISNAIVKIGCELNFVLSNRVSKHSS